MTSNTRRSVILSSASLLALSGCLDRFSSSETIETDDSIPLPSYFSENEITGEILRRHQDNIETAPYYSVTQENIQQNLFIQWERNDSAARVTRESNSDVIQEQYLTQNEEYTVTYTEEGPRYSQKVTQLPDRDQWAKFETLQNIIQNSSVELTGFNSDEEFYQYTGSQVSSDLPSEIVIHVGANPTYIKEIIIKQSDEIIQRYTVTIRSQRQAISEPVWLSEANQVSKSVQVRRDNNSIVIYNSGGSVIPQGSTVTIISPSGIVYDAIFSERLPQGEAAYITLLQNGRTELSIGSQSYSNDNIDLEDSQYLLIGFGPQGEQYFDTQI